MDHDEELQRALVLSLMESKSSEASRIPQSDGPVNEIDEDEDQFQKDLQLAIEASKADSQERSATTEKSTNDTTPTGTASASSGVSQFLSERAKLEKERIERLKRLRGEEGGRENAMDRSQQSPTRSATSTSTNSSSSSVQETFNLTTNKVQAVPVINQLFWDGELRPTANKHSFPREDGKPTFRLTEVLGPKADISFAIISSYATSVSWIYEFFDPRTPVIIISQPDDSGNAAIKNILPNWIMTVPFLRNGRGCQHMKFMLIFYNTGRLRVVISTANLVSYDWRDIENTVWLQDFPQRPQPLNDTSKATDDLPSIMQKILQALNVRPALQSLLTNDHPRLPLQTIHDLRSKWDFSKVQVKLVPSIAGKHEGWSSVIQTGHTRLMKIVRDMGLRTGKGKSAKDLIIECQGSSIGTYSTQWMNEFHWSARGESADDWLDESKARRAKLPFPPIKIVFPSLKTVKESVLGEPGGGTMFCRTSQWEGAKFPRELFHDSNSTGGRVLMHTKMIIATFQQKDTPFSSSSKSTTKKSSTRQGTSDKGKSKVIVISDSETESESEPEQEVKEVKKEPIGWAYVGSHNFTPSAWGTLSGSGFNPILNVVNYELGIVFLLYGEEDVKRVACFKRPPRKYIPGEDRAWIQEESPVLAS